MPLHQQLKQCFFIGPMKNMQRLIDFRDNVLKPLLTPSGFTVDTPDAGDIGNIMKQVLLGLEQADILVADITHSNPNVMYELGVYHAFGKPYVVIKEDVSDTDASPTPFDIAEFRFHTVNFTEPEIAKAQLGPLLDGIIKRMDKTDWFGNPVTDFYNAPVAEIPTAIGLFKNYKKNFLDMLLPDVFQKEESGAYKAKISEEVVDEGKIINRLWTDDQRAALTIEISIPARLYMTSHPFIAGLKSAGKLTLFPAKLQKPGRPFGINYRTSQDGNKVIVDIPTVLSTLNESIQQRRKLHQSYFANAEWEVLEQQELERFYAKCMFYKNSLEETYPECEGRLLIQFEKIT